MGVKKEMPKLALLSTLVTLAAYGSSVSHMCTIVPDAASRGYPRTARVNYMCFDHHCPRRENIMQLYNGLLKVNKNVQGSQVDCRERSCRDYLYESYGFCMPCCNAPYAESNTVKFPNCKKINVFKDACYHYRRHGKFNLP